MKYFKITKKDYYNKIEDNVTFKNGYKFGSKTKIWIYDYDMIEYILAKKLDKYLKDILSLYLLLEDDDDESANELIIKLDTMKKILFDKYSKYLSDKLVKRYNYKFDDIEKRIENKKRKKSIHR